MRIIRVVKREYPLWKDLGSGGHRSPHPPRILLSQISVIHSLLLTLLKLLKRVAARAATTTRETIALIEVDTIVILL
jgi:hypothetical protein